MKIKKQKKILKIAIAISMIGMTGCKPNAPIELNYCEMLTKDQSFVNNEETDPEKRESNYQKTSLLHLELALQPMNFVRN